MTVNELKEIQAKALPQISMRHTHQVENETKYKKQILVCGGTGCTSSGSNKLIDEFYAQFAPLVSAAQRKKLQAVVEKLKKI